LPFGVELRAPVKDEVHNGTCGSTEEAGKLKKEHSELLERIDAVLRRLRSHAGSGVLVANRKERDG